MHHRFYSLRDRLARTAVLALAAFFACGVGADSLAPIVQSSGTAAVPAAPSGPSIQPTAKAGKDSQDLGAAVNIAAGVALMTACLASEPVQLALCAMGALALAQGKHDQESSAESAKSRTASAIKDPDAPAPDTAKESARGKAALITKATNALRDAGYTVSADGVKTPDGKVLPPTVLNSPGGLVAAGFDPGAYDEAKKITSALPESPGAGKVAGVPTERGPAPDYPVFADEAAPDLPRVHPAEDRKHMVAGKTIDFDGEPIGVRGRDIFEMMHDAYQKRRTDRRFIESDAVVRMPAHWPVINGK